MGLPITAVCVLWWWWVRRDEGMDRRITLRDVQGQEKLCGLSTDMTLAELLTQASSKLSMDAKRLFTHPDGVEVDDVGLIRDNETLLVTDGAPAPAQRPRASSKQRLQRFKLAVIGSGGVGKSAITMQYVQGRFIMVYDPTIEDAYRKAVSVDNQPAHLDILDTAGQEDYVALRGQWMQEREGFLLVYSVNDRRTFENLTEFYNQLLQIHETCPPLVIVANKCDLPAAEHKVTRLEGEQISASFGCPFIETSAKTAMNVDKAFGTLVREARKRRGNSDAAASSKCPCTIL